GPLQMKRITARQQRLARPTAMLNIVAILRPLAGGGRAWAFRWGSIRGFGAGASYRGGRLRGGQRIVRRAVEPHRPFDIQKRA
ncbi:MAG TPA: hypothetical protein VF909_14450, partial [Roseiflexaceae bacterium]